MYRCCCRQMTHRSVFRKPPTLSPGLWITLRLAYGGQRAIERKCGPVKHTRGCKPKLLPGGERWKELCGFNGSVVRQYFENTVVYCSGFLLQLALPNLIIRRLLVLIFLRFFGRFFGLFWLRLGWGGRRRLRLLCRC